MGLGYCLSSGITAFVDKGMMNRMRHEKDMLMYKKRVPGNDESQ